MTLSIMIYGAVVGTLLAGAAHFLERALRAFDRPARWLWASAMGATSLVPILTLLLPERTPNSPSGGTLVPLEAFYRLWDASGLQDAATRSLPELLDRPLLFGWVLASALMILLVGASAQGLRRKAVRWERRRAAGEEVLISDGLGPAVLGFLNPCIVLPPWALALEPGELELVILHETEHRKARDPAVLGLGLLFTALAPWNPTLWWQLRRLRLAVEGDCDGRVLARGVPRRRYGRLLLGVASEARGLFPLTPALSESGGSFLERRLQMMKKRVGKGRMAAAAVAVSLGAICLALACETPTPPQAQDAEDQAGVLVELAEDGGAPASTYRFRAVEGEGSEAGGQTRFRFREPEGIAEQDAPVSGVLLRRTGDGDASGLQPQVYIDGVLQGEGMEAVRGIDPDRIDRIEVVKGSAAEAVFGEDATGGVIQIFLKKKS